MQPMKMKDGPPPAPDRFPVSVLLERRAAVHSEWVRWIWEAIGVVVGVRGGESGEPRLVFRQGSLRRYLVGGLEITLHPDECESYYHNLTSPRPRCYVITHPDEQDPEAPPEPFLVSMSFDEAHAYLEGDEPIYGVEIPPELYRWTEAFVLTWYAPGKKRKRRLTHGGGGH